MFDTEDWNDGADAQHLSKSIHHHWKFPPGLQKPVVIPGARQKVLRKCLLETLRVLEAASQSFQEDNRPLPSQDLSNCGDEEAETTVTCSKPKKKKRNRGLNSDISTAGSETPSKKRKQSIESPKMRSEKCVTKLKESRGTAQDGPGKGVAVTVETLATRLEDEPVHQLSRKQWKNKQKNKKRNKNKFKMAPESKGITLTEPVSTGTRAAGPTKSGALSLKSSHSPRSDNCSVSKGPSLQDNIVLSRNGPKLSPREGRVKKLKKILQQKDTTDVSAAAAGKRADCKILQQKDLEVAETQETEWAEMCTDRSASLRSRMEERLKSARFRYINQQLYTSSSQEARRLFQQDPEAFQIYHHGFSAQLQRWPQNPTDEIIKYLKNRPASLVVADFGCGDCKIARSVRNTVHSFDLVALNNHVTVCDMAKVPLQDESVDIAVFCLALMGTNLREFFQEANRVLKPGGILKVAEVASRFEDIRAFISALANLGFKNTYKDTSNSFFYTFDFLKTGSPRSKGKLPGLQLKACLYKKR
ncbi:ribosomal RNA-processing protein 8 [Microcaecilia unicolor]|uniref:Ribosomal RNA-processing protein 8 n=1 Tax=Microcaecilia unicolor TaxID=1415580 RepID=A0A6P7XY45_9AMPH|nr:ribosomal RNA-processing protein 8 [Microcaecilia unicolor]XP_030055640.1 ribosomal RNA-processing protein 8 [Microcaecilia unicolor]